MRAKDIATLAAIAVSLLSCRRARRTTVEASEAGAEAAAAPDPIAKGCGDMCRHRASCAIDPDVAACQTNCVAIKATLVGTTLSAATNGDCADARAREPSFEDATNAAKACRARVDCLHEESDYDPCVSDLAAAAPALAPGHLEEFASRSCDALKKAERDHQTLRQMVRSCRHLLACEIPGTMGRCLSLVKTNMIVEKRYDQTTLASWETEDCATLRKKLSIDKAGGGGAVGRYPTGWFGGSWTDGSGRVHTHDAPPPGVF